MTSEFFLTFIAGGLILIGLALSPAARAGTAYCQNFGNGQIVCNEFNGNSDTRSTYINTDTNGNATINTFNGPNDKDPNG